MAGAVDVIGSPLGKLGGSMIGQILIFGVDSLAAATLHKLLADQFEDAI